MAPKRRGSIINSRSPAKSSHMVINSNSPARGSDHTPKFEYGTFDSAPRTTVKKHLTGHMEDSNSVSQSVAIKSLTGANIIDAMNNKSSVHSIVSQSTKPTNSHIPTKNWIQVTCPVSEE